MSRTIQLPKPPIVSLDQYAGKWIAWNRTQERIIASGRSLQEVSKAAADAGEKEPVFEKVRKAVRFMGANQ